MTRITVSPVISVLALMALVCGLALVGLAAWVRPLAEGAEAARAGDLELALERYAAAEARFERVPLAKQILPAAYHTSVGKQLELHYARGEYERVIDKATLAPPTAGTHFWSGCALFQKGQTEEEADALVAWLNRAEDEFRKALERRPEDWDAKFNYELTRHLLGELRQDRATPQQKLVPLLRPEEAPERAPVRRVG